MLHGILKPDVAGDTTLRYSDDTMEDSEEDSAAVVLEGAGLLAALEETARLGKHYTPHHRSHNSILDGVVMMNVLEDCSFEEKVAFVDQALSSLGVRDVGADELSSLTAAIMYHFERIMNE